MQTSTVLISISQKKAQPQLYALYIHQAYTSMQECIQPCPECLRCSCVPGKSAGRPCSGWHLQHGYVNQHLNRRWRRDLTKLRAFDEDREVDLAATCQVLNVAVPSAWKFLSLQLLLEKTAGSKQGTPVLPAGDGAGGLLGDALPVVRALQLAQDCALGQRRQRCIIIMSFNVNRGIWAALTLPAPRGRVCRRSPRGVPSGPAATSAPSRSFHMSSSSWLGAVPIRPGWMRPARACILDIR